MIGSLEFAVIAALTLALFGPEKLIQIARELGRLKQEVRKNFSYLPDGKKAG